MITYHPGKDPQNLDRADGGQDSEANGDSLNPDPDQGHDG